MGDGRARLGTGVHRGRLAPGRVGRGARRAGRRRCRGGGRLSGRGRAHTGLGRGSRAGDRRGGAGAEAGDERRDRAAVGARRAGPTGRRPFRGARPVPIGVAGARPPLARHGRTGRGTRAVGGDGRGVVRPRWRLSGPDAPAGGPALWMRRRLDRLLPATACRLRLRPIVGRSNVPGQRKLVPGRAGRRPDQTPRYLGGGTAGTAGPGRALSAGHRTRRGLGSARQAAGPSGHPGAGLAARLGGSAHRRRAGGAGAGGSSGAAAGSDAAAPVSRSRGPDRAPAPQPGDRGAGEGRPGVRGRSARGRARPQRAQRHRWRR